MNNKYLRISKGIYLLASGNYHATRMINGVRKFKTFTNKAVAIKWYKSL